MIEESEPEECDVDFDSMSSSSILARWLVLFLLHLQSAFRLSKAAVQCLFSFLATFLCVLGQFSTQCKSTQCKEIAKAFPRSIYLARGRFCEKSLFKRLVVCRKCKRVYPFQDCFKTVSKWLEENKRVNSVHFNDSLSIHSIECANRVIHHC